jgi:hypothetical protein
LNAQCVHWNIWGCACIFAASVIDEHHMYYVTKSCFCWFWLQLVLGSQVNFIAFYLSTSLA